MAQMDAALDPLTPKKGLIDALMGGSATAGTAGIAPGEMSPNAGPPPALDPGPMAAPPMQDAPKPSSGTTLMEGDPGKLADPSHIAKSPKYQFLSEATNYGRGQEGALLKDLQGKYGQYWNGVTFDGKGNFDVGNSDPAWDGVKHVDAYGGYNDGGNLKARWGVENPNAPQGGGQSPAMGMPSAGGNLNPLLQGNAQGGIQSALGQYSQQSDFLKQLLAKLQGGGQ